MLAAACKVKPNLCNICIIYIYQYVAGVRWPGIYGADTMGWFINNLPWIITK